MSIRKEPGRSTSNQPALISETLFIHLQISTAHLMQKKIVQNDEELTISSLHDQSDSLELQEDWKYLPRTTTNADISVLYEDIPAPTQI